MNQSAAFPTIGICFSCLPIMNHFAAVPMQIAPPFTSYS